VSVGTLTRDPRRGVAGVDLERARATLRSPAAAALAALTALAAVLRFTRIGHQGFWFDEANTALLVHFSPGKMLGLIPQTESTPPLYYCLVWVWARVFGYGETALRSLSALAGVTLIPVAYGAGAKLVTRRAGVIVAALAACNPLLIWYSQEARSYSLAVLLSALSLMAFAYARENPSPRLLAVWTVCAGLALSTHYYALLIVVPEALWLLLEHRHRRALWWALGVLAVWAGALLALAISQNSTGHASWIASAPLGRRVAQIVPQFLVGFGSVAYNPLIGISVVLCVVALVMLATAPSGELRRRTLMLGALVIVGMLINLALVAIGVDNLLTRNTLALWLPAALVVAGGLCLSRRAWAGIAIASALCVIGVIAAVSVAVDRDLQRPDWRGVARILGPYPPRPALADGAAGRAIFVQHYRDLLPLSLYLPRLGFVRRGGSARVRELDVVSFTSPKSAGFCWWGSACNLWPSRAQRVYRVAGFREVSRRRIYQFTVVRLLAPHPVTLTPAIIARALTTTRYRNDEFLIQPR
jgi:mannosyltransferase